jgi:hypothetical protein
MVFVVARAVALLSLLSALGAAGAATAGTALAAGASVSSNWAGYAVSGKKFTRVNGAWTQPQATCSSGRSSYSAFWVGLGGFRQSSSKIEQIGTESDCDRAGNQYYSAWYELAPAAAAKIRMPIKPGDSMAASVTVGRTVALTLRDLTTGRAVTKRLRKRTPDTSSAEWIAEAPSGCDASGCQTLPLANFGTVGFSGASVVTAGGKAGTIANPAWSATALTLQGDFVGFTAGMGPVASRATPTPLAPSGDAFSITWQQTAGRLTPTPGELGPGSGYPGPPADVGVPPASSAAR